jgi:hypothetical protein
MQYETPQTKCRVGVARADITPPVGIYHRMWGAATHERAAGVHRPLVASALVLAPHGTAPQSNPPALRVLVTLDHCLLGEIELQLVKQTIAAATGLDPRHVLITFTHTHGAGLMSLDRAHLPGGELIEPYLHQVARQCGELVQRARAQATDAVITYGYGVCSLATNRDFFDAERNQFVCGYNPQAAADQTLLVARVTSPEGQPLATIVNYACHPTTLAWENELISPDYIGSLRETVERETAGAPCIFLQGASAELGPREGFVGDVAIADRNGRQLAYAVLEVLTGLPPAATSYVYQGPTISGATLGTWKHEPWTTQRAEIASLLEFATVELPLGYRTDRPDRDKVLATLAEQQAREREAFALGDHAAARDAHAMIERQTRLLRRLDELPAGQYPYTIQAWRLGDAVWIGVRGELYSELQVALRRHLPDSPVMVITLVDGWGPSYIVPRDDYGRGLYQESIAILAPGSLEIIIEASLRVAERLLGRMSTT